MPLTITGANSAVLPVNLSMPGMYTVAVSDRNGCTDTSAVFVYPFADTVTTVVSNLSANDDINVYPNPGTSMVHIDAPVSVNISVISADGKIVMEFKNTANINVAGLPGGMYLIKIYDEHNRLLKNQKFTKME